MEVKLPLDELEQYCQQNLPQRAFDYYANGRGKNITLKENKVSFQRWKIIPRYLQEVDCYDVDTSINILGSTISTPICASPTGFHKIAHPDGELATANGCYAAKTCMTVSAFATYSYEEIATSCPSGLRWCQMYIFKDRNLTLDFVRRAESAGYKALVLTIDTTPLFKSGDQESHFELPDCIEARNFKERPVKTLEDLAQKICSLIDPDIRGQDIEWLKSLTKLPVVLKGVMSVDDAIEATKVGVEGIIISNKGGRNLDDVPGTLEVLPGIVDAVQDKLEVYIDGGIRSGADVFKALALGARAVFIGRPVIWGLAYNGSRGVTDVFQTMNDELRLIMAHTGCGRVSNINQASLRKHCQCRL